MPAEAPQPILAKGGWAPVEVEQVEAAVIYAEASTNPKGTIEVQTRRLPSAHS
jgi:hypothetical protein